MTHTGQQLWDNIYDFDHYEVSEVKKIVTRWRLTYDPLDC